MELLNNEGNGIPFEISGSTYIAPDYAKELKLTREDAEHITLSDPNGTHTTFVQKATGEYLPKTVSFQASPSSVRMVYEGVGGYEHLRLMREIAPTPPGVAECGDWTSISTPGCRTLAFEYLSSNTWAKGAVYPSGDVNLASIKYYNSSGNVETSETVAKYNYGTEIELIEEWDPRVSPPLQEKYTYNNNKITSLTPPGQEPWEFAYYNRTGRPLKTVSRASLVSSPSKAKSTIVYDVPLSGAAAPYDMSASAVAKWGQSDYPVDATAIFPPTQVPPIDTFTYTASIGAQGSGNGQLSSPRGVTVDGAGNEWVVDTANNRIEKFSPEGKYLSQFGTLGSGNGQLDAPSGIALDGSGNIVVADTANNRIEKFSPEGSFLESFGSLGTEPGKLKGPAAVAVDGSGNVWVADTGNNRVQKFSAAGAYLAAYGSLSGPAAIAAHGNAIYVADTGNNRIVELFASSPPTLIRQIGTSGSDEGQLSHPEGLAVYASGNLWVADTGNNRIQELSAGGKYLGQAGTQGSSQEQFSGPAGIAVGSGGLVAVADKGNNRIDEWNSASPPVGDYSQATVHYMDPDGYQVNTASAPPPGASGPSITTAETDTHGNVVRSLSAQNRLLAMSAEDPVARSHELDSHSTYSADGTELLESWGPLHSVRLESGETKEARAHTVVKYEDPTPPAGQAPYYLPTEETAGALQANGTETDQRTTKTEYEWKLRKPKATIVDPGEGHLAIKTVTTYDESTGLPVETRQPSNSGGGGAGTTKFVYYSAGAGSDECQGHPIYSGRLCRITPAAQATGTGRPELLVKKFKLYNNLDEPTEIVESPGGGTANVRKTLLTYDAAGRQLTKKIEGGGQAIPKVETSYDENEGLPVAELFKCESECGSPQFLTSIGYAGPSHTALKSPSDVEVDAADDIWVVDKGNNRIVEYSEGGEFIREAGGLGSAGGKLSSPSAIDVDSGGNVWVADTTNNRVVEFSATGAFLETFGSNVNKTKVEAGGTEGERNLCTAASGNICQAGTAGSSPGQMSGPLGIAAPSTGGVWVVDTGNSRLEKFNKASGANTAVVSGEGSEAGKLKSPSAIAFTSAGWFWVADTGNNRIEEWNSGFNFERAVGKEGSGNGEFKTPVGIAVEGSDNVWVVDQGNNRVQKLSDTGAYLQKFGSAGTAEGQFSFSTPTGIAFDGLGNFFVADPGNNRAQMWSTNGFDSQETKTTYDALGRPVAYEDADGNVAKTTYDLDGRPVEATDPKGRQTIRYDATSGLPVELEDSAAGVFTAGYNADGAMVRRTLPDGLTAETTYDPAGEPMHLTYTKASDCGAGCTWLDFGLERSITGQIRSETGTLTTGYFSNDMVASQSQGGVSNMFQLDASLRQRQRLQGGGLEGTEVFHYDGPGDSPAWTKRGSIWTRNIAGIGGELAAVQERGKEITLQLTNLHGDVSATAPINPEATSLKGTFSYDEFGNPTSGSAGRFGWLGGKVRRTEFASGLIQMGARSYVPQIGRFLSVDPVVGGSASAYDYANADPLDQFDLEGTCAKPGGANQPCHGHKRGHWRPPHASPPKHGSPHVRMPELHLDGCTIHPGLATGADLGGNEHGLIGSFAYSCETPQIVAGFYQTPQGPGAVSGNIARKSGTIEIGVRWNCPKNPVSYCVLIGDDKECGIVKWVSIG